MGNMINPVVVAYPVTIVASGHMGRSGPMVIGYVHTTQSERSFKSKK